MDSIYQIFLDHRLHLGLHQKDWNPKMKAFIIGCRHKRYIFDLQQTFYHLKVASSVLKKAFREGERILIYSDHEIFGELLPWVCPKHPSLYILNQPPVGGFLTNWQSLYKYAWHLEEGDRKGLRKKSQLQRHLKRFQPFIDFRKQDLLLQNEDTSSQKLSPWKSPGLLLIFHGQKAQPLMEEARRLRMPTIALLNSDGDPSLVTYPIPANNQHPKALLLIAQILFSAFHLED